MIKGLNKKLFPRERKEMMDTMQINIYEDLNELFDTDKETLIPLEERFFSFQIYARLLS
jgi:hypothetical protein